MSYYEAYNDFYHAYSQFFNVTSDLQAIFNAIWAFVDTDGSHFANLDEITNFVNKIEPILVKAADADGNGSVNPQELKDFLHSLDLNGDGTLSVEEYNSLIETLGF